MGQGMVVATRMSGGSMRKGVEIELASRQSGVERGKLCVCNELNK